MFNKVDETLVCNTVSNLLIIFEELSHQKH